MTHLILASGSPRRRELIRALASEAEILVTDIDESVPDGTPPDVMVRDVAIRKAAAAAAIAPGAIVVAADTTVALDGHWLAKPEDDAEAATMVARLQGREHQVFTGVAVASDGTALTDVTTTHVAIAPLDFRAVAAYVAIGEGSDKAGAYGIQGSAGEIVTAVEGCFTNVVGLPLCSLALLLARSGVTVDVPAPACGFRSDRHCPHPIWRHT